MNFKVLTVNHYGDVESDNRRITISPNNAHALATDMTDITVQGRELRHTVVLLMDGGSLDLVVNHADLAMMEEAIGAFPDYSAM